MAYRLAHVTEDERTEDMGNQYVLADSKRCIGCSTCMAACMMEHPAIGNHMMPRLGLVKTLELSLPVGCRQCDDPDCQKACPQDALYIMDGSVRVHQQRCIGCNCCTLACPNGSIVVVSLPATQSWGSLSLRAGKKPTVVKCDLCADRPQGPACVAVCITKALGRVTRDDELSAAS